MFKIALLSILSITALGCTGTRTIYEGNGLTLVHAGADPTPINGGYTVLIAERDGNSRIVRADHTPTVAEQIAKGGRGGNAPSVLTIHRP